MVEFRKAKQSEENDILDFINMVFSQLHVPHDFSRLLGKVYAHPGFYKLHYVGAEEDGHIKSTVALLPLELLPSADLTLKLGYIGSVSVHRYARSKGYMKGVMNLMLEDAKKSGYDLLALGGQRQRYQYFGFERGGAALSFKINRSNIRHALKNVDTQGYSLYEIQENDSAILNEIYKLGQKQPFRCSWNRERLWDILHSWYGCPYALLNEEGHMLGYLFAIENTAAEYAFGNQSLLPLLLPILVKLWMEKKEESDVLCPPYDSDSLHVLNSFAESYQLSDNDMFRILNWKHVLETLFCLKARTNPLPDGDFRFAIENTGIFEFKVQNGSATVEDLNLDVSSAQNESIPVFTEQKAIEFFFSPLTSVTQTDPILKSWLPLPLYLSLADTF